MSVRDINKSINISDSLNGEVIGVLPFSDDNFNVLVPLTINQAKLVNLILDTIKSEHGCLIKVGYNSY